MKQWLQKYYPLLIILVLAAGLRINLLFVRGTFWFDEMFSVHFSRLPWPEALRYAILETNPPLFTLLLRGWLRIADLNSEFWVRFPSLIFGLASIAVLYLLAQKIFSRKVAVISAIFMSLSGLHIFLNTEARVYGLLTLLTIISFYFFHGIFWQGKKYWPYYGLTNFLLLFSHLTAWFTPLAQLLILALIKPAGQESKKWRRWHAGIGIVWLAWFIPSLISKFHADSLSAWYFDSSAGGEFANLLTLFISGFINANLSSLVFTVLALLFLLALALFWQKLKHSREIKDRNFLILLCLWGILPVLSGSMLGVFVSKFYVAFTPALYLMMALVIADRLKSQKQFALTLILILAVFLPAGYAVASQKVFSWYDYTNYIESRETDNSAVFILPFNDILPLRHYYRGQRPLIGLYLREDNLSWEERIVRYNWNKQVSDKAELAQWLRKKIAELNLNQVFYLQYTTDYDWVHQIFLAEGWTLSKVVKSRGYIDLNLFEFHAPN